MIFPPFWILKVADRNGRDNYANRMFVHVWQKILEVFSIESPMEKKNDSLEIIITPWNGTGATKIARGWLRSSLNARLRKVGCNSASEITGEARRGGESALSSCGFIKIQFSVRLTSGIIKHSGVEMMRPETCSILMHNVRLHVTLHSASNTIRNLFDFSWEKYARD